MWNLECGMWNSLFSISLVVCPSSTVDFPASLTANSKKAAAFAAVFLFGINEEDAASEEDLRRVIGPDG
jgi:hypothetical protein